MSTKQANSQSLTPGPWKAQEAADGWIVVSVADPEEPMWIASLGVVNGEADAKLMASAPLLLAACQEFVRKCEAGEARSTRSYKQMKEAIHKALEGGLP